MRWPCHKWYGDEVALPWRHFVALVVRLYLLEPCLIIFVSMGYDVPRNSLVKRKLYLS